MALPCLPSQTARVALSSYYFLGHAVLYDAFIGRLLRGRNVASFRMCVLLLCALNVLFSVSLAFQLLDLHGHGLVMALTWP